MKIRLSQVEKTYRGEYYYDMIRHVKDYILFLTPRDNPNENIYVSWENFMCKNKQMKYEEKVELANIIKNEHYDEEDLSNVYFFEDSTPILDFIKQCTGEEIRQNGGCKCR